MPVGGKNKGRLKNHETGFQTASGVFGVQQLRACVPHIPYARYPVSRDVQVGRMAQGTHVVSVGRGQILGSNDF